MTRNIRPRAALGAVAVAATLLLASCSAGTSGDASEFDPDQKVELEMSWWGDDARAALFGQVIDLFEDEYPNITVTQTPVGSPDDLFNRLATDFAGGGDTAPDVFALGGAKPQEYGEPTGGNATAAFLDLDLFKAAGVEAPSEGWTWDDLIQAANEIGSAGLKNAEGKPVYGLDLRIGDIIGTYSGQVSELGMYDWD